MKEYINKNDCKRYTHRRRRNILHTTAVSIEADRGKRAEVEMKKKQKEKKETSIK